MIRFGTIDHRLKDLAHPGLERRPKLLLGPKKPFIQIGELEGQANTDGFTAKSVIYGLDEHWDAAKEAADGPDQTV